MLTRKENLDKLINYANEILALSFICDKLSIAQTLIENFNFNDIDKEIDELEGIINNDQDDSIKGALNFVGKDEKQYREIIVDVIQDLKQKKDSRDNEQNNRIPTSLLASAV